MLFPAKKVKFEFYAPQAKKAALAGDFNGWDKAANPLKLEKDGYWRGGVQLKAGRYEYRYWVDEVWQNDQKTVECVPNPFGTWNCVRTVR